MTRHARMTGRPTLYLPGKDHASIAAQYVLDRILAAEGASRDSRSGASATWSGCAPFMAETRALHDRPARAGRRLARLEPRALHHGRGLGAGGADRLQAPLRRWPRLPDRGARQLVPRPAGRASPTWRRSPRPRRARSGRSATTCWTRRVGPTRRPGSASRRRGRRRSWATPRWPSIPRTTRYRGLVGRTVRIPFVDRDVPIIADDVVERAFGTGAVKITPAHDLDDFETGRRHGLAADHRPRRRRRAINETGGPYAGLDRYEAASGSWPTSRRCGDLEGASRTRWSLGRCQRSDDVVEPRLKTQWFIRVKPLADKAIAAVREGRVRIVPVALREGLLPLAREHPRLERQPPALVGPPHPGLVLPGRARHGQRPARRSRRLRGACGRPAAELTQDPDIFDTWFSSGLWPFSTLGWPERHAGPRAVLPGHGHGDRPTTSSSSGSPG